VRAPNRQSRNTEAAAQPTTVDIQGAAEWKRSPYMQGMVDHLKLIPRQVVDIVKADSSVLKDYDAFWAALAGPD
jgi:hypothetical protein